MVKTVKHPTADPIQISDPLSRARPAADHAIGLDIDFQRGAFQNFRHIEKRSGP
jgi:hypothetical protein